MTEIIISSPIIPKPAQCLEIWKDYQLIEYAGKAIYVVHRGFCLPLCNFLLDHYLLLLIDLLTQDNHRFL